jgi:hypothetical protein
MQRETVDPGAQLALALEMFEVGVAMKREKLKRQFPSESDDEIERRLECWLSKEDEPLDHGVPPR